jgi:hypothetical protein
MKSIIYLFLFFLSSSLSVGAFELQSGDVILMSFNCYECKIIESESNSLFSHSGVVVRNANGEIQVAQALVNVKFSSLQEFLKYKTPNTKASVYRPVEFENTIHVDELENHMREVFENEFKGLAFDSQYRWNNFDSKGREMLYCSEFVVKFLDHFLSVPTKPFPLSFQKNYNYWFSYFKGDVPQGELGNSPASISTDSRFQFIGTID